jgi:hypothetical protein
MGNTLKWNIMGEDVLRLRILAEKPTLGVLNKNVSKLNVSNKNVSKLNVSNKNVSKLNVSNKNVSKLNVSNKNVSRPNDWRMSVLKLNAGAGMSWSQTYRTRMPRTRTP